MTPTPYDRAHAAMEAEPENEALRLAVYDRLADAQLFLLLEADPDEDNDIIPQLFETEAGDIVLAFDTEDRLAEFAQGGPVHWAALPGRVIAQHLAGENIGLGINLGVAESAMLLPPEAMEWLTEALTQTPVQTEALPLSFDAPELPPAMLALLLPAFEAKFDQITGMASHAALAGVTYEGGRRGHVLAILGAPEEARPGIAKAMGEALAFSGLDAGELDVTFLSEDDPAAEVVLSKALVLHLPDEEALAAEEEEEAPRLGPGMDPSKPPFLR
ncbi:SseB family protein [Paenirhodobacter enshiensis]|uniref:SseB family protein n=1 Tax=Paenirhodobacter enshiensis TaxID=1105367 RepID=UPI0035B1CDD9